MRPHDKRFKRMCELRALGLTMGQIGKRYHMTREAVRLIIGTTNSDKYRQVKKDDQARLRGIKRIKTTLAVAKRRRKTNDKYEEIYELRKTTKLTWYDIADAFGFASHRSACLNTRKWCERNNKPWPIKLYPATSHRYKTSSKEN